MKITSPKTLLQCFVSTLWEAVYHIPPLTHIICTTRLKFFDPTAYADSSINHSQHGPFSKGLELLIKLTTPHLAQDH